MDNITTIYNVIIDIKNTGMEKQFCNNDRSDQITKYLRIRYLHEF